MTELTSLLEKLRTKDNILFLTTSTRWVGEDGGEQPKSTQLAYLLQEKVGPDKVSVIEVPKLKIYPCEGNVSTARGNTCGTPDAVLKDHLKNPTGHHRCWASLNNPDDELWQISKQLFESDCVVFFVSVRWGQANSEYQKLIERLTWIENRHSTLGEPSIVDTISAGLVVIGHNWRGGEVLRTQQSVLKYFGFQVDDQLCWEWHFTVPEDESNASYVAAAEQFQTILHAL